MRFGRGAKVRFHLACASVRKRLLHETRQSCRDNLQMRSAFLFIQETYGRGGGVSRGLGVGVDLAGVAVDVGVAVAVAVGVAVAVAVGVDVGVGVGVGCTSNDPTSMRPLNTRTNPGPRWS